MTFSPDVFTDRGTSGSGLLDGGLGHRTQWTKSRRLRAWASSAGRLRAGQRAVAASAAMAAADAMSLLVAGLALEAVGLANGRASHVLVLAAATALVLYWGAGLYPGYRLHAHERLRRRLTATVKAAAFAGAAAVLLARPQQAGIAVAQLGLGLVLQPVVAGAMRWLLHRAGLWGETARIIGEPATVAAVTAHFAEGWRQGIRPATSHDEAPGLVLVADGRLAPEALRMLRTEHADILLLADLPGQPVSGLTPADVGGAIGLLLSPARLVAPGVALRRMFDLLIAVPALVLVSPLLLISAAAILAVDPGPVVYRQVREGRNGSRFEVLKLRTMYRDAEQRLEALLNNDPAARAEWSRHYKLRRDPRILPMIGRLLRNSSIDELPQLLNVIAGQMRIVGPRPFPLYHLAALDPAFRFKRALVTPGVTGLWQVSGRSNADIERQQQLDAFYVDNQSFWLDLHILFATPVAVVRGRGAC